MIFAWTRNIMFKLSRDLLLIMFTLMTLYSCRGSLWEHNDASIQTVILCHWFTVYDNDAEVTCRHSDTG